MTIEETTAPAAPEDAAMRAMYAARKRVFIDQLGWDLPVLAGLYELDAFDTPDADYIILMGQDGRHRASARILPTQRSHLLGDLYPHLCDAGVPRGETIREISRFCIDPDQDAAARRIARDELVSALADHAISHGITDYTAIAEQRWFEKIAAFGWRCEALGEPRGAGKSALRALRISIDSGTIADLTRTGIYVAPASACGRTLCGETVR